MNGNGESPLGGRLPLVDADTLDAAQRKLFDDLQARVVPWADAAGFHSATTDGKFIGPFNAALRSPTVAGAFLQLQASEEHHTSLSDRVRQVVILAVGAVWAADYEIYAHSAVARQCGIPDDAVRSLAAGTLPHTLDDDEKVAYRFARQLSTSHRVDDATFSEARKTFGDRGIVDMIVLAGTYYTVCGLLNAFEVPAPSLTHHMKRGSVMPISPLPTVTLTPVAYFPEKYFLENLAVRADGSVLITAVWQKELWCVPGPEPRAEVRPVLVHTFEHMVSGVVEVEPDVFIVCVSDAYESHESHLARIDLTSWMPGDPVSPEIIYTFDERAGGLNGGCLIGPGVMLVADSFSGFIWRIDLGPDARSATARVWLAHDTMAMDPDSGVAWPPQPGVNGVRFGAQTGYVFYTSTAQKVFMRVAVDPKTLEPAGDAEFVAAIDNADDFCLDESARFAYVTRHRAHTLDRVPLEPRHGSEVFHLAGDPLDETLIGPSSAAWRRRPGDHGRVAYVTIDGGTTASPDGIVRKAALLRLELQPKVS